MRSPGIVLLVLTLGALSAVAVGCGEKENPRRIPAASARQLDTQLARVREAVDGGNCESALPGRIRALQASVSDLSSRVDPRLRARLQQGVTNLARIAPPECVTRGQPTTPTVTTDTTATQTTPTVTTDTTATQTTPTVTTDTTATQTTPTPTAPTTTPAAPAPPGGGAAAPTPRGGTP